MSSFTSNNTPVQAIVAAVTVRDLSLPLEMRHPLTVLRLLQFVDSYNDFAPADELIHFPSIPMIIIDDVLASPDIGTLTATQRESLELLFNKYRYDCPECEPQDWTADWAADAPAQGAPAAEGAQSTTAEAAAESSTPAAGEGSSSV